MHYQPRFLFSALCTLSILGIIATLFQQRFLPNANAQPVNMQQQSGLNATVQGAGGPENIMILLDSSYSMGEKLGPRGSGADNKMTAAKRAVMEVLDRISPSTQVGLRVYGNSANTFNACHATTLLVPLGYNNRNLMSAKLLGVRPTGSTPISYSVIRSLNEDFVNSPGRRSILLISDGIETCGEDPCNLAVRMQQLGARVKIDVIGLGISDYDAIKQLRCVALTTKGKFFTANTSAELANSLSSIMAVQTNVQAQILPHGENSSLTMPNNGNNAPAPFYSSSTPPEGLLEAEPIGAPKKSPLKKPASRHSTAPVNTPGSSNQQYEDQLLPAAVPIQPHKR